MSGAEFRTGRQGRSDDRDEGTISVLVVDDHRMVATSLSLALGQAPQLRVVATADSLAAARAALAAEPPDVVVLDEELPDGAGVDAIEEFRAIAPDVKVILLTAAADDATLVAATEAGCSGYLMKTGSIEELEAAVRAAAAGEVLISPSLLGHLVARVRRPEERRGSDLTARELEVLRLIAEGLDNATIAERLGLSVNTVRNHVQNILSKLNVHSKLEALAVVVREGLLGR